MKRRNFLLVCAIAAGSLLRFHPVWQAGFVIHDGGMFAAMARDIQAEAYRLPLFTSYNQAQIPFAYPPLMLYLLAALDGGLHIPLLALLRWLPPLISTLTIPVFYALARRLLAAEERAALAAAFFAFAPSSLGAQIMGGGLTRSAGALFALLFLYFLHRSITHGGRIPSVFAALSGALLVLSHPEWSLHALLAALVFWGWFGRSRAGSLRALWIAGGVLLLTAPWWGTVIARHGLAPSLAVSRAPQTFHLSQLITLGAWSGEVLPLLLILAVVGWLAALFSPLAFLPLWLALDLLIEPRGALRTASLEMALLSAYAVFWCFDRLRAWSPLERRGMFIGRLMTAVIILLVAASLFNGMVIGMRLSNYHALTEADRQAFAWIRAHVPPSARFLLLTPQDIFMAPALEWFPSLAGRVSLLTIQGTEWLSDPARDFTARYQQYLALQPCLETGPDCLANWSAAHGLPFDYVYISLAFGEASPLYTEMAQSSDYDLVYDAPMVKIFREIEFEEL
jgi:hypothetical protein